MIRCQSYDPFAVLSDGIGIQILFLCLHILRRRQLLPAPGRVVVHSDLPFLAAGDGAVPGDAGKGIIIIRLESIHKNSPFLADSL